MCLDRISLCWEVKDENKNGDLKKLVERKEFRKTPVTGFFPFFTGSYAGIE